MQKCTNVMTTEVDPKIHFKHFIMFWSPVWEDFHFHNTLMEITVALENVLLLGICYFYMNTDLLPGIGFFLESLS